MGFRLERGTLGFRDKTDAALPETGLAACRTAWHAAARAARGGRTGEFAERQYPQNFHTATINDLDGRHVVLFHAHQPLTAFVTGRQYWYTDEFREAPAWAGTLAELGFVVLSAAQLHSPLMDADTSALSAAEWQQIRRWRPGSLGAALFNSWD